MQSDSPQACRQSLARYRQRVITWDTQGARKDWAQRLCGGTPRCHFLQCGGMTAAAVSPDYCLSVESAAQAGSRWKAVFKLCCLCKPSVPALKSPFRCFFFSYHAPWIMELCRSSLAREPIRIRHTPRFPAVDFMKPFSLALLLQTSVHKDVSLSKVSVVFR